MSPTQRTQAKLRKAGYLVASCERKMPCTPAGFKGPLITQDLFGFIDTLAVNAWEFLAIQTTAGSGHAARVKKILRSKAARALCYYVSIEVWSWSKRGPRGKRKLWTLRREPLTVRLLPKKSLLRDKLEKGEWPWHGLD